jgi:hypothetical protein
MPLTVVHNSLNAIADEIAQGMSRAALETAIFINNDAKSEMRKPKRGRAYRRGAIERKYKVGGRGYKKWQGSGAKARFSGGTAYITVGAKFHRASAPGEAPAVDTSNLINAFGAEKVGQTGAIAYNTAEYAVPLEFGSHKMAARPFYVPAAFRAVEVFWKLSMKYMIRRGGNGG